MISTPMKHLEKNPISCTPPISTTKGQKSPLTPRQTSAIISHLQSTKRVCLPKSSIYRQTPLRLDIVTSDWTLVNTGPTSSPQKNLKRPSSRVQCDRFIPQRNHSTSTATSKITYPVVDQETIHDTTSNLSETMAYTASVAEACGLALNTRILAFKPAAPESGRPIDLRSQYNRPLKSASLTSQCRRRIASVPERVLDAPGLIDDYYLNLLDWSRLNKVAIGLERSVYIWDADNGDVSCLMQAKQSTYVSGIKWSADGCYLSIGLGSGDIQIWDTETGVRLRTMYGHEARVGVLAWDKHLLSSGCRDGSIWNHDVRIADHKVSEWRGHGSEVCGLEWRADGSQLASGGNDNLVNIWDARSSVPKFTKTNHIAAVKALSWCPWQLNILCTGGGSQDRILHFWNATTGARTHSIDTGSQVTSVRWSTIYRELISSHGFPNNHLSIWQYPSLAKTIDIPAHESRVLHSCLSPDGQVLATAASDENLKFWRVFESTKKAPCHTASITGNKNGLQEMTKTMAIR
ncbi:hypothetical protein PCK1_001905 [Pneumocystis canis]|nr:hypothetical protein PCK1_001905 [Pneumocystis canis]